MLKTENVNTDQPPPSKSNMPQKRKPARKAVPPAFPNQPNLGQSFPSQWNPAWNFPQIPQQDLQNQQHQQHPFMQNTQMPVTYPYNPYNQNQWVQYPLSPTTRLHPYNQYRQTAPTGQNFLSTGLHRNQNLPRFSPIKLPEKSPQSQFGNLGMTESGPQAPMPQFFINYSPMYSATSSLMNSDVLKNHQYERGTTSAFQAYQRPPTCEIIGMQSQNNSNQISTHSNFDFNQPVHSTLSSNEDSNQETAVNIVNSRIEYKKELDPANVVEEIYDFTCVICQDIKKDTVLLPCRHLCVCEKCSDSIDLCPLCRKEVIESMTVFT